MTNSFLEHEKLVNEFMQQMKEENPERYQEICDSYPSQTHERRKIVKRREIPVGLLGLSPSRVSTNVAARHGIESEYEEEGS